MFSSVVEVFQQAAAMIGGVIAGISMLTAQFSPVMPTQPVDIFSTERPYDSIGLFGCGDGIATDGEECDTSDFKGQTCASLTGTNGELSCSSSCFINTSQCIPTDTCGNGVEDGTEECDGTATASCADVYSEPGYIGNATCSANCTWNTAGCIRLPRCGDGTVEGTEECDDGNAMDGDGCSTSCAREYCGDGTVNNGNKEECDDGNMMSGDGCSTFCATEAPQAVCGNGTAEGTEECDEGWLNGWWGSCGYDCRWKARCGDGMVNDTEQCDDGNAMDGDGCSTSCTTEAPQPACGDGMVNGNEQCDDGNAMDGDGCSTSCTTEAPQAVCGNGTVEGTEECDGSAYAGSPPSYDGFSCSFTGCASNCTTQSFVCTKQ